MLNLCSSMLGLCFASKFLCATRWSGKTCNLLVKSMLEFYCIKSCFLLPYSRGGKPSSKHHLDDHNNSTINRTWHNKLAILQIPVAILVFTMVLFLVTSGHRLHSLLSFLVFLSRQLVEIGVVNQGKTSSKGNQRQCCQVACFITTTIFVCHGPNK